jgi:FkbM family methyltransferase
MQLRMGLAEKVANNYWLLQVAQDPSTRNRLKHAREVGAPHSLPHELRLRGLDGPLCYRPGTTDLLVVWELFRTGEYDVKGNFPFRSVIDCGANCGYFLGWLLRRTRGSLERYVGVEADRDSFAALERQVQAFGLNERSSLLHAAAWGHDGVVSFDDEGPSWGHKVGAGGRASVPSLSIGSILDAARLERVDLLKLDIEGGEKVVLESDGWADRVDAVVAELHGGLDYAWFSETMRARDFVAAPPGALFRSHPGAIRRGSRFEALAQRVPNRTASIG